MNITPSPGKSGGDSRSNLKSDVQFPILDMMTLIVQHFLQSLEIGFPIHSYNLLCNRTKRIIIFCIVGILIPGYWLNDFGLSFQTDEKVGLPLSCQYLKYYNTYYQTEQCKVMKSYNKKNYHCCWVHLQWIEQSYEGFQIDESERLGVFYLAKSAIQ